MANIERLETLADWIETNVSEEKFYFGDFWNRVPYSLDETCGTVACLCGWAPAVFSELRGAWAEEGGFKFNLIIAFFGLSIDEFDKIFMPGPQYSGLGPDASLAEALAHLRAEIELFKQKTA